MGTQSGVHRPEARQWVPNFGGTDTIKPALGRIASRAKYVQTIVFNNGIDRIIFKKSKKHFSVCQ